MTEKKKKNWNLLLTHTIYPVIDKVKSQGGVFFVCFFWGGGIFVVYNLSLCLFVI